MSETKFSDKEHESDAIGFYDMGEGEVAATISENEIARSACVDVWLLKVCAELSGSSVRIEVFLVGQKIGGGTISPDNAEICVGANVGLAKAKICITGNFSNRKIWINGQVCSRRFPSGWSCRDFRTILLRW